jgi:hypothetical protein
VTESRLVFRPHRFGENPLDDTKGCTVEHSMTPPPTPEDATEATAEQQDLQRKLDHADDDPDAPATWQTRRQIPDEN